MNRIGTAAQPDAPLRRVDPDVARDIAAWFIDAPAVGRERLAAAAYRDLHAQTDRAPAQVSNTGS